MFLFQSPQKKAENILKGIEKGKTNETETSSLMQILEKEPAMISRVLVSLASIMAMDDERSFISACLVMNRIAIEYPDKVSESMEKVMERLSYRKKDLSEFEWIPALEFFSKIYENHPESMKTAVPSILVALGNSNKTVRETAYFLLACIATRNPYFFKYSSSELIRVMNGLNIDERLYACKIIQIIASVDPRIVEKTYDMIEDFSLNHPDSKLRSEAGFAASLLRPGKTKANQPDSPVSLVKQDIEPDRKIPEKFPPK